MSECGLLSGTAPVLHSAGTTYNTEEVMDNMLKQLIRQVTADGNLDKALTVACQVTFVTLD